MKQVEAELSGKQTQMFKTLLMQAQATQSALQTFCSAVFGAQELDNVTEIRLLEVEGKAKLLGLVQE